MNVLQQALEALELVTPFCDCFHHKRSERHELFEECKPLMRYNEAITALRKALEQEPVAFVTNKRQRINLEIKPNVFVWMPTTTDWEIPLYTHPQPKAEQSPLDWEPIQEFWRNNSSIDWDELEIAIKAAAHGIGDK